MGYPHVDRLFCEFKIEFKAIFDCLVDKFLNLKSVNEFKSSNLNLNQNNNF